MNAAPAKREKYGILVINPGSTSTKTAIFAGDECFCSQTLQHASSDLKKPGGITGQMDMRRKAIDGFLKANSIDGSSLSAIAGRGGLLRPLSGGVYEINDSMLEDLRSARWGEHASNLGALLAHEYSVKFNIPAYIVDPVTVDEFDEASKISGVPGIERKSRLHALNIRAVARRSAANMQKDIRETRFVIAHLGGGISVCALQGGRIIDSTDALLGEGPFTLERSGTISLAGMIELIMDKGMSKTEIKELLSKKSGFSGFYGVDQLPEVYKLIDSGDRQAAVIMDAMVRQVARWIGGMAAVLASRPHAIILTGGMLNSERLANSISHYVKYLGPVKVYAGEFEMEALAEGVLKVLKKEVEAQKY